MLQRTECFQCDRSIQTYRLGAKNFCSRACFYDFKFESGYEEISCDFCHSKFTRWKSKNNMNQENLFCSIKCRQSFRIGKKTGKRALHKKGCQCIVCRGGRYWLGKKRDPEMVERIRQKQIGMHPTLKTRMLMSCRAKHRSPEVTRKSLIRACPSSLELKAIEIYEQKKIRLTFTGDGAFLIGRKCPDFVNKDAKTAVDVFYRRHKEDFRGGLLKWKRNRKQYFARRGWKLIFLDETMVNEEYISKKLKNL